MLVRARTLFVSFVGTRQRSLELGFEQCAQLSNLTRDVVEANKELDEFFGVSNSAQLPNSPPTPSSSSTSEGASTWRNPVASSSSGSPSSSVAFSAYADSSRLALEQDSGPDQTRKLTHIDSAGAAAMVDVSQKVVTTREAQASCRVSLGDAYGLVAANSLAKGDVLKVAQLAGICGAKATAALIPLCHNIPISKVDVQLHLDEPSRCVMVRALARTDGKTGVEMEALTAASVAALTVYDMCKAAAKDLVVSELQLDYKSGGRSGTYLRQGLRRMDLLPSARPPL